MRDTQFGLITISGDDRASHRGETRCGVVAGIGIGRVRWRRFIGNHAVNGDTCRDL